MANDGLIHYNIVALNEMITCLDERCMATISPKPFHGFPNIDCFWLYIDIFQKCDMNLIKCSFK